MGKVGKERTLSIALHEIQSENRNSNSDQRFLRFASCISQFEPFSSYAIQVRRRVDRIAVAS